MSYFLYFNLSELLSTRKKNYIHFFIIICNQILFLWIKCVLIRKQPQKFPLIWAATVKYIT